MTSAGKTEKQTVVCGLGSRINQGSRTPWTLDLQKTKSVFSFRNSVLSIVPFLFLKNEPHHLFLVELELELNFKFSDLFETLLSISILHISHHVMSHTKCLNVTEDYKGVEKSFNSGLIVSASKITKLKSLF